MKNIQNIKKILITILLAITLLGILATDLSASQRPAQSVDGVGEIYTPSYISERDDTATWVGLGAAMLFCVGIFACFYADTKHKEEIAKQTDDYFKNS